MMNIYIKSNKDRLYWFIDQYLAGRINEDTFCNEFYYSYNLEVDVSFLSKLEKQAFDSIREVADRFSAYVDPEVPEDVYTSKQEIKQVVESAKKKLSGHGWAMAATNRSTGMETESFKIIKTLLNVNKNARRWNAFISTIPSVINKDGIFKNPITINFIIPGAGIPVAFSGTKLFRSSDSNTAGIRIDIAVPDIEFPEDNPIEAQGLILELISDAFGKIQTYGGQDEVAAVVQEIITQLRLKWSVSRFHYDTPGSLPYTEYEYSDGTKTGVYVEEVPDLKTIEHSLMISRDGTEVA